MTPGTRCLTPLMRVLGLFALTGLSAVGCLAQRTEDPTDALLRQGKYEEVIGRCRSRLRTDPGDVSVGYSLIRAYQETGRLAEAEQTARELLARAPADAQLHYLLGEIFFATGRDDLAEAEYRQAMQASSGLAPLAARLSRGILLRTQGKYDEAEAEFRALVRRASSEDGPTAGILTLVARALVFLEEYHEANRMFAAAIRADPQFLDAYLHAGMLYVEKYNYAEAASFFREALSINPASAVAYLGLARSKEIEGGRDALALAERALALNPALVPAYDLLAAVRLEADDPEGALAETDRALRINARSPSTRAIRAAVYYLQHRQREFDHEVERVLAYNPHCGELFLTLARFATTERRYQEAVGFGRRAVALSPRLWSAWALLGINLLRVGQEAEAREVLERAFAGDPFNVWVKNTLDLLDSMRSYRETVTPHFIIRTAASEHDVLVPYVSALLEEAYATLTEKYRFRPQGPIIVELFPNHDDFAVKTVGLPGLGALGACFGRVIVMDSPSARPPGTFNWGSTAWHEFVHVITLQATDHKIPRWFSEGLSVYEERQARPGWGDDWTLGLLRDFVAGKFLPLDKLDAGFVRPETPDAVPRAYFQASLICQWIVERFGFEKILAMLQLYRENRSTREVLRMALGLTVEDFDRLFQESLRATLAHIIRAVDVGMESDLPTDEAQLRVRVAREPTNYFARFRLGTLLRERGETAEAIVHLTEAIRLFPYHTGREGPYWQLAEMYRSRGEVARAVSVLGDLIRLDEDDWAAHKLILTLGLQAGMRAAVADVLPRAVFIDPFDQQVHRLAGDFYLDQGQAPEAIREFRVLLGLKPSDRADAHFHLARAYAAAGDVGRAKSEVLRALEIAPGFEKAQQLLLSLVGK